MFHSLSQRTIRKPVQIGLFFITALLMVLRFSYSTSFLYPECYAYDSAIFQIVGKHWAEGVIPYQQLFDHKGPLIFFINAIGYRIYPHYGLIPLQVISLTLTLFLFFRAARLWMSRFGALFSTGVSLLYIARTFTEGNMTEEYSLPFLAVAVYLFSKWYHKQQQAPTFFHSASYAFGYGICFAGLLMLRVTNAALLCGFVFVITLGLLLQKQWKTLLQNAGAFLGGFFLFFGPFALYFAAHGALYDMLYGTIFYNISYSSEYSILHYYANHPNPFNAINRVVLDFGAPLLVLFAVSVIHLTKKIANPFAWGGIVGSLVSMYVLFTNRPYTHYFMIVGATIPFIAILISQLWNQRETYRFGSKLAVLFFVVWLLSMLARLPSWNNDPFLSNYSGECLAYVSDAKISASLIPEEDRDSVLCYNVDAQWYLINDIQPCQTYFIHQDWQSSADSNMQQTIAENLWNNPPKWMVVDEPSNPRVQQLLAEQYTVVLGEEQGFSGYTLYQRTT